MIEKWRESVDVGSAFGALLTDCQKPSLPHEFFIAKLCANGFDMKTSHI